MTSRPGPLAPLVAALLLLVACGGDDDPVEVGTDPTTETPASEPGAAEPTEPTDPSGPTGPVEVPAGEVPSTLLLLDGGEDLAPSVPGPGVARTREQGRALLGRHGLDPDDEAVLARLDDGTEVVVAAFVAESCNPPTGAFVDRAATTGLDVRGVAPPTEEGLACEVFESATAVLALAAADVPVGTVVEGRSDDAPTGVGEVQVVAEVDADAEPAAVVVDDVLLDDEVGAVPGAPDLDLPTPEDGAQRLVFVVDACAADAAELVADEDAGTVTAVAFPRELPAVDCDAPTPHLVVADLAADLAGELEPVPGP